MTCASISYSSSPKVMGYRPWLATACSTARGDGTGVAEPFCAISAGRDFRWTERHLQCVWFDPALRPGVLMTEQGDTVVVEHPGQWNLENGPDFLDAVLRVGSDRRRLAGDVEIHIRPSDWQRHGHDRNPLYNRVVAHVTYFPDTAPTRPASRPNGESAPECRGRSGGTTAGIIRIQLKDGLASNPFFSFESIDLAAYPYTVREPVTPCARVLRTWHPDRVAELLDAAGRERLQDKAARMASAFASRSPDQVLYEETMTALGYKNNRAPFRYLAEHFPLDTLRHTSGRSILNAYALLMGAAGLLPAQTPSRWDTETRAFVRQLWDHWWKHQAAWSALALRRDAWKLSGLRPQNHPQRRLMLAALIFCRADELTRSLTALSAASADEFFLKMTAFFQPDADTYWQRRLAFAGSKQSSEIALLGAHRAAALVSNVLVPFVAALGNRQVLSPDFLSRLPPEDNNQIVRQTAHNLLGPDHNPRLYHCGLRQQGLLQIFHDFCLTDRSRCENCMLLKALNHEAV